MSTILRRIPALLASGCILAAIGTSAASGRMPGPKVFRATEALSYVVGSKKAIGYFQSAAGQCQLTLMVAEAIDPDVGHAPSAARLSVAMAPGQSVSLASVEGEAIVATCGIGGETLEVARKVSVRS
jgi:hypothetical protein